MDNYSKFVAHFDKLIFTKDGGGKITLEFSQDAIQELQKVQNWNCVGLYNLAIVMTPVTSEQHDDINR